MLKTRIEEAIDIATYVMAIDGDHHKVWGLDQIVKVLAAENYDDVVKEFEGETGKDWDEGTRP